MEIAVDIAVASACIRQYSAKTEVISNLLELAELARLAGFKKKWNLELNTIFFGTPSAFWVI